MKQFLKKLKNDHRVLFSIGLDILFVVLLVLVWRSGAVKELGERIGLTADARRITSFLYSDSTGEVFAPAGTLIAVGTSDSVSLLDRKGQVVASRELAMSRPSVDGDAQQAVFADLGGSNVCILRKNGTSAVLTSEYPLLFADTGSGTNFATVTEAPGYCGRVTVYNSLLTPIFSYDSGISGHPVCARMWDDKLLVVGCISSSGSSVRFFSVESEQPYGSFSAEGELLLGMDFLDDGTAAVLTDRRLLMLSPNGTLRGSYDFGTNFPDEYSLTGSAAAVVLVSNYAADEVSLVTVDAEGQELASMPLNSVVTGLSACGDSLLLQFDREVTLYHFDLNEALSYQSGQLVRALLSEGDTALLMKSYGASVVPFRSVSRR